ncbi:MAG TPA: VIT1/CCC1 transporter family protein [Chitinophagales bacterium]|nr:VIT1/CCC1 transporter family protein [Chitinophagales bacterium]
MHEEKHFESSAILKDVVIGMADGLTVPFALAAGLSGAVDSNVIVITAGIAEIVAGSIAMGLGGYLAGKTDADHFNSELKREYDEVERLPDKEKQEIRDVLAEYGISASSQNAVANELALDKNKWVDFMMKFELGLEKPKPKRATQSARNIALSYVAGGFIPLSAYFFTTHPYDGLIFSSAITLVALLAFGFFKAKVTGQPVWRGAYQTAFVGALAAGAAFFIARAISL